MDTTSNLAQQRFGNAKSISSAAFSSSADSNSEYESSQRLARFQGSSAISSAELFGEGSGGRRGGAGAESFDVSAGELIGKLSFQARQDINQVRNRDYLQFTLLLLMVRAYLQEQKLHMIRMA